MLFRSIWEYVVDSSCGTEPDGAGRIDWVLPDSVDSMPWGNNWYRLRVRAESGRFAAYSDTFYVQDRSSMRPRLHAPATGDTVRAGDTVEISWSIATGGLTSYTVSVTGDTADGPIEIWRFTHADSGELSRHWHVQSLPVDPGKTATVVLAGGNGQVFDTVDIVFGSGSGETAGGGNREGCGGCGSGTGLALVPALVAKLAGRRHKRRQG